MLNISLSDQKLLYNQSQLKKLQNGLYLQDINDDNFKYIKNKFFAYESVDKAKLLNVGSGLFTTVGDTFASFVGNPSYDFGVSMNSFVEDIVALGFCTMGLERENGQLKIVYQPAKNYWSDDGIDKISRLYMDDDGNYYVLVQSYYVGYIENKLYITNGASLFGGTEVSLDTIPQTRGMLEIIQTGLSVPALIVVQDSDISLLEQIKSIVYGIDRQIVMSHTQYLQNVESFILFKNIKRPQKLLEDYNRGKRIDFSQIGRIINADDTGSVEFVNNLNSLIDTSIKDMDNYIRRISSITTVPIEFLGLDSNEGAVGLGSRTLRHGSFIKKVQYYRDLLDEALLQFVELSGEDIEYTRPDIFAKTDKDLVEELMIAREAKLISLVKAIEKYNGYTEEEAIAEYERLQQETLPLTIDNE